MVKITVLEKKKNHSAGLVCVKRVGGWGPVRLRRV